MCSSSASASPSPRWGSIPRATPPRCRRGGSRPRGPQEEVEEGLPQASGGRKEYTDDDGKVTKVVEWFGFKLHLIVDIKNEVVLAYEVTDTKAGDGETLPVVLEQAQANLPPGRIKTLAYDKAADGDDGPPRVERGGDHAADPDARAVEDRARAAVAGARRHVERGP